MRITARRISAALVALAAGLCAPLLAQADGDVPQANFSNADVKACLSKNNVFVIVDPGEGDQMGGCATSFATGADAMRSAGFTIDDAPFLTTINGIRADYNADGRWWTYWHRDNPQAAWKSSEVGLTQYQPKPGSIEAWSITPASNEKPVEPRWAGYAADPKPTATPTPTAPAKPTLVAPYEVPGYHTINGRKWNTKCEPYGNTIRCWTYIWSKQAVREQGRYRIKEGWHFNNLTYLPYLTKAQWGSNPLANTGQYTLNGRKWRTECNTKLTGKNGCRSYIWATVISADRSSNGQYTYRQVNQWVLNNMVRFKVS